MSNTPTGDPIFQPSVQPVGGPAHEHKPTAQDWVVIHRGGPNSKAHVESLGHKLTREHIVWRIEHDDDHKVVLEVAREDERRAVEVIGAANSHGEGETAHQTREDKIEAEERAELQGPFKAATTRWLLVLVAVAVVVLLALWMLPYLIK
jgi:hypothetical protein